MGVYVSVLTCDGQLAAEALGTGLVVTNVRWELLPEDKVRLLEEAKEAGQKLL